MKIAFFTGVLLWSALSLCAADVKKPLPERVSDFAAKYDTEAKITQRLQEWIKEEPNSPEPYILAANSYLKVSNQVQISTRKDPQGFPLVDPKTNKAVGSISEGPSPRSIKLALDTLTAATEKFPLRMDIFVGRMAIARLGDDVPGVLATGKDFVKGVQSRGEKMLWVDDAPLPEPFREKVQDELQGRISWLYGKEKDDSDDAARALAEEGLKVLPDSVEFLNDVALYHCYKKQWPEARPFLERAEKADPKDLLVKENLAKVFAEMGDKKSARAKNQEIIKLAPDSDEAKRAQKLIRELEEKRKK